MKVAIFVIAILLLATVAAVSTNSSALPVSSTSSTSHEALEPPDVTVSASSNVTEAWPVFENSRYGYRLRYPSHLKPQAESGLQPETSSIVLFDNLQIVARDSAENHSSEEEALVALPLESYMVNILEMNSSAGLRDNAGNTVDKFSSIRTNTAVVYYFQTTHTLNLPGASLLGSFLYAVAETPSGAKLEFIYSDDDQRTITTIYNLLESVAFFSPLER